MNNISVTIPNEHFQQLKKKSSRLGVSLEKLLLLSIEDILSQPDEDFSEIMHTALNKNRELYQRLA